MIGLSINLFADFSRDNNTQIVTDNKTGLEWQDNEASRKTWGNAIKYCENLELGGYDDWRLPNINELNSLLDESRANPNLSPIFKYCGTIGFTKYWSSTVYKGFIRDAWIVNFRYGDQLGANRREHTVAYVRCVRGNSK